MGNTAIVLEVNGQIFGGWESVSFGHSLDSLSKEFSFDINDATGGFASGITEESECTLYAVEDLGALNNSLGILKKTILFSGIIFETTTSIDSAGYGFSVNGNSRTIDLVECSAIVKSNTWKKAKISKIIKDICEPYAITVDTDGLTNDQVIEDFSISSGDTAFAPIEKLCKYAGVIPIEDINGNIMLVTSSNITAKSSIPLILGQNVLRINRSRSVRDRRSKYVGKATTSGRGKRWSDKNLRIKAVAFDTEITRFRPMVFIAESKEDKKSLQSRVNWEAQVRKGRSNDITVEVVDIYQRNGDKIVGTWQAGLLVDLIVDKWDYNDQLIIAGVNFNMSEQGRRTTLILRDISTYAANPGDTL